MIGALYDNGEPRKVINLDVPQKRWPDGSGYQPQQGSLIRDVNVRVKSRGNRMLAVCPTAFLEFDYSGGNMFEPHGVRTQTAFYTAPGPQTVTNDYYRNGLFSDGHVENRYRKGKIMVSPDYTGWLDRTSPWMPPGKDHYNARNQFYGGENGEGMY